MRRWGKKRSGNLRVASAAQRVGAALAALGVIVAGGAAAQGPSPKPVPSLDRFDGGYGFPTYPGSGMRHGEDRQVPFIFYGGDVNALRLNDVPKIHLEQRPVRKR